MTENRTLPAGWQRVLFGDVVRQVKETTKDPESDSLTRVVGLEHLDPESLPLRRWHELDELPDGTSFTRVFRAGQVLFGKRRAYQRKVAVADFDGVCSGDILIFESSGHEMLAEFLPYLVQSDGFFDHALGTSAGSLSPRTKWQELAKYEFALPPAKHQKSIVKVLERARQAANKVARVETALVSLRDSLIDDATWDSSCGRWSVPLIRVGDLLDGTPRNGLSPKASSEPDAVRSLTLSAVRNGRLTANEDTQKWCEPSSKAPEFRVDAGDVFIVRGNGNRNLVGRAGLALVKPEPACIYPDLLIRLRFDKSQIDPFLATELWNHRRVHGRLLDRAKSSNGIYKVNGRDISSHELPVPPAAESRTLLARLRAIDELQTLCQIHSVAAGKLVSALREKMLHPAGVHNV